MNGKQLLRYVIGLIALMHCSGLFADEYVMTNSELDIELSTPFNPASLQVIIDNQDITELAQLNANGIHILLPDSIAAGQYELLISFISSEGYSMRKRVMVDTARDQSFYDATSGLGITLRGKLHDRNDINEQDHQLDVHVGHGANWQVTSWSGDVEADIWLFDRGTDIDPLQENRAELINYHASARKQNEDSQLLAELGYVQLNESLNTIHHLARRGAHANYSDERISLDFFSVNSRQYLGSEGGAGLGDGSDDTIVGVSTGWNVVATNEKTVKLKLIYSQGAEDGDSLGLLDNNKPREGEVAALVIESRFDDLDLNIQAEVDQSSFDSDTSDNVKARDDKAYGLRVDGSVKGFNYRAALEHVGTDYAVVANPLLQNDREYISLAMDFDRGEHGFALRTQVEHDNLDEESSRARLNKTYLSADYLYRKGRGFSSLFSLQSNQLKSEDEPSSADIQEADTHSVLARFNVLSGRWNNLLSVLYSELDDSTDTNNDSQIESVTLSTSLFSDTLIFTPSLTHTDTEFNSGQQTSQVIFSLHVQGKAYENKLDYQLSASVSDLTDNASNDVNSSHLVARTSWSLGHLNVMTEKMEHSIGLEMEYYDSESTGSTQEDSLVWLSYSINIGNRL